jgi:hypothetical protein
VNAVERGRRIDVPKHGKLTGLSQFTNRALQHLVEDAHAAAFHY